MPKAVFTDFSGGLTDLEKNAREDQFYVGIGVDIYSKPGYVLPSQATANISISGLGGLIREIIRDGVEAFLAADDGKLRHISNTINDTINADVDGAANNFVTVANMQPNMKGITYAIKSTISGTPSAVGLWGLLFYQGLANTPLLARIPLGQINPYVAANGYNSDFGSKISASFQPSSSIDICKWDIYLWATNGRYIARYDGNGSGNWGTFTSAFFDLGLGWQATCVFPHPSNYLGIVARAGSSLNNFGIPRSCKVVIIDGSSTTRAVKEFTLKGIYNVLGVEVIDGTIYCIAENGERERVLGEITDSGFREIMPLKQEVSGTMSYLAGGDRRTMETFQNRLFFGLSDQTVETTLQDYVMSYGQDATLNKSALTIPISGGGTNSTKYIGAIRGMRNKLYFSRRDGSSYYLDKLDYTGTTYGTATLKFPYKDFGQKVRVNYVKVYYKPLVSGDSLTLGIDKDYGTAVTLGAGSGNVSYGNDPGTTSKRFDTKQFCHSFRPTVSWVSGGTPISKIIVDYDFVEDL